MQHTLNIPQSAALDFVALGALVHRLDPGIIPFRKAHECRIHVSGGEFNVAANLADCFRMKTAVATAMVDYPIGDLIAERVKAMGVRPFYKHFAHNGVNGPNMATVFAWHLLAAQQAGLSFDGDADPRKPRRAPVAAWFLDRLTERNTRQSASLLVERARARGRAKQWGKAIEDYERAVRLLPDDASLKVELAHAYEQRKNGDKSDKSVH